MGSFVGISNELPPSIQDVTSLTAAIAVECFGGHNLAFRSHTESVSGHSPRDVGPVPIVIIGGGTSANGIVKPGNAISKLGVERVNARIYRGAANPSTFRIRLCLVGIDFAQVPDGSDGV